MKICSFPKHLIFLVTFSDAKIIFQISVKQPYLCVLFNYVFCANHFMYKFINSKVRTLLCLKLSTILWVIFPATRLWPVMITICSATLNTLVLWNHYCSWGGGGGGGGYQCLWLSWITLALEFTSQRMYIQAFV